MCFSFYYFIFNAVVESWLLFAHTSFQYQIIVRSQRTTVVMWQKYSLRQTIFLSCVCFCVYKQINWGNLALYYFHDWMFILCWLSARIHHCWLPQKEKEESTMYEIRRSPAKTTNIFASCSFFSSFVEGNWPFLLCVYYGANMRASSISAQFVILDGWMPHEKYNPSLM